MPQLHAGIVSVSKHTSAGGANEFSPHDIRVNNLAGSLSSTAMFLCMKLIRQRDYPSCKFTLAFVGYGDITNPIIELTYNLGRPKRMILVMPLNTGARIQDIYQTCDELRKKGAEIIREPGRRKQGGTEIAFHRRPNRYKIELIDQSRRGKPKRPAASSRWDWKDGAP